MVSIVLFDESPSRSDAFGLALSAAGHDVEVMIDLVAARSRLEGAPADLMIVSVSSTDGGPGHLVGQCRAAWPDCRTIALMARADGDRSMLSRMGLWEPHHTVTRPISPDRLVRTVAALIAHPPDAPDD